MQDNRIRLAQIALLIVMLLAYRQAGEQWNAVMSWCAIAIVALLILQNFVVRWRESRLWAEAQAEWSAEWQERFTLELARGITDTSARFLVQPVMEARWPRTIEQAQLYLDERRRAHAAVPPTIEVQALEVHR